MKDAGTRPPTIITSLEYVCQFVVDTWSRIAALLGELALFLAIAKLLSQSKPPLVAHRVG